VHKKKQIGFQIRTANNLFMRSLDNYTNDKYGDDAPAIAHGWVLDYLAHNQDKDIYQKDIEKEFGLTKSSVSCMLKILEERQCIKRQSVQEDARLKKIIILPKGETIYKQGRENLRIFEEKMAENISEEDKEVFLRVLNQFKENILSSERKNFGEDEK